MSIPLFLRRFISSFDIYRIGVNLNFQQKEQHKSIFGGIVSIFSFVLIGFISWIYGKELIFKENPIITQSLREVSQAERIYIDKDNIILMVGIQNAVSKSFIDPTVFYMSAVISNLEHSIDPITGQQIKKMVSLSRKISLCSRSDIGIESLKSYFDQVNYPTYFCLKNSPDQQNYIEGDFDQQKFSQMYININRCVNSTQPNSVICKSPQEIDKILESAKVSFYLSDKLILPSQQDNPFKDKGINLYSHISPQFKKEIQLYFTNSYIENDEGLLFSESSILRGFSFSELREVQYYDESQTISRVLIRIRKIKEDYMKRRYAKIVDIAAQIGGLIKLTTLIGALIVIPFQRFHFHKAIVNELFSFQTQDQQIDEQSDKKSLSHHIKEGQIPNSIDGSQKIDRSEFVEKFDKQDSSLKIEQTFDRGRSSKRLGNILNQAFKIFKIAKDGINYKWLDYISHFFCPKLKSMEIKKPLLDYSIKKVMENLDILYILNKLTEIDKLKYIIFDENQLKLFEYIPKPKITIYDANSQNDQTFDQTESIDKNNIKMVKKKKKAPKFYFQADKTQQQKAEDAFQSLTQIFQKPSKSEIDMKLLDLVDPELFCSNQQNTNIFRRIKNPQQTQLSHFSQQEMFPFNQNSHQSVLKFLDNNNHIINRSSSSSQTMAKYFPYLYREDPIISNLTQDEIIKDDFQNEFSEDKESITQQFGIEFEETGINLVKKNRMFFEKKVDFKIQKKFKHQNQNKFIINIKNSKSMDDLS